MDRRSLIEQIPALRRYARALTGDAWAADDLVQDALERACVKWRLWLAGSDLRAWLFTLMHNLYISQVRQRLRQGPAPLELDAVEQEPAAPTGGGDDALDLQRCLLQLPDEQRVTLLLVTLEGMTYSETARITGVPVGTVMSRLSRARSRLQELLEAAPRPGASTAGSATVHGALRRLK
ncbi:RNA polymerase sigma factor [Hylemonella gracilis]|uniref:RNA polymerase sigma factor n=1 Tax=Hylemonella gracilis TaxID=80880 RepID=A0A4P6UP76_9BURK|nr:RNA polymerase sigma factor [Hylemonella gracilis]QBK05441.1 RNA polymerase sigma factor [Hylemonella gracilis]